MSINSSKTLNDPNRFTNILGSLTCNTTTCLLHQVRSRLDSPSLSQSHSPLSQPKPSLAYQAPPRLSAAAGTWQLHISTWHAWRSKPTVCSPLWGKSVCWLLSDSPLGLPGPNGGSFPVHVAMYSWDSTPSLGAAYEPLLQLLQQPCNPPDFLR